MPEWHDFQRSGIFQYVSPIGGGDVNLTGASEPARIRLLTVPPNYFALLDVKPQLGRSFDPEDQTPGFNLEVLISDGLWKRAFGSDPHILGKSVRLDNDLYSVVGVMPPGFHDPGATVERKQHRRLGRCRFRRSACPASATQFADPSGSHRANRTWTDD